jgi:hypothetical protein
MINIADAGHNDYRRATMTIARCTHAPRRPWSRTTLVSVASQLEGETIYADVSYPSTATKTSRSESITITE